MKKLAIIGGGAAGLAAAVAAGEALRTRGSAAPAVEVVLYEADDALAEHWFFKSMTTQPEPVKTVSAVTATAPAAPDDKPAAPGKPK